MEPGTTGRRMLLAEAFAEIGDALEGLAFLGMAGGSEYLRVRQRGLVVAEGVSGTGEGSLLDLWDGGFAIAAVDAAGRPSVGYFPDRETAQRAWMAA